MVLRASSRIALRNRKRPRVTDQQRPPTDMRRQRKRTERGLLTLVIAVLVFVGGGLIALIYGPEALLAALPCLLGGAGAILGLYLLFVLAERWLNR